MEEDQLPDLSSWSFLSYARKAAVLHKCFAQILPLVQRQLVLIQEIEHKYHPLDQKQRYAVGMIRSYYEEMDYAISLSKTKNRLYIYHPVRSCFEKLMHVAFFWRADNENRDKLARLELLRSIQDMFIKYTEDGDTKQADEHRRSYQKYSESGDPDIAGARIKPLFGKALEEVCRLSGFKDYRGLYRSYRDLCDLVHSGFVVTACLPDRESFLNSIGLISLFRSTLDMLWAADSLLFPTTKPLMQDIQKAKRICVEISIMATDGIS